MDLGRPRSLKPREEKSLMDRRHSNGASTKPPLAFFTLVTELVPAPLLDMFQHMGRKEFLLLLTCHITFPHSRTHPCTGLQLQLSRQPGCCWKAVGSLFKARIHAPLEYCSRLCFLCSTPLNFQGNTYMDDSAPRHLVSWRLAGMKFVASMFFASLNCCFSSGVIFRSDT